MGDEEAMRIARSTSFRNRERIAPGVACGCYYCLSTFDGAEVAQWVDAGQTALCPRCEIDAVLPVQGGTVEVGFLREMQGHMFRSRA